MSYAWRNSLSFPVESRLFLEPHLPPNNPSPSTTPSPTVPFTTLTFATSLDSALSLSPGTQTVLSGPESKAMTHYLRSRHDAILIGVGTALADNPSLNCRLEGVGGYGGEGLEGQPRPVVVDPRGRWGFDDDDEEEGEGCKLLKLVREGKGRAPFVVTAMDTGSKKSSFEKEKKRRLLTTLGGKFIYLPFMDSESGEENGQNGKKRFHWNDVLKALAKEGLKSVMIEGGASIINSLLVPEYFPLIDSVIVTIAPTWLGQGGVVVSPPRRSDKEGNPVAALRLKNPVWHPFGEDVVLCGKIKQ